MKKKTNQILTSLLALFVIGTVHAQEAGDIIEIPVFNYESTTRDTFIDFSEVEGLSFERIYMLYNMRCHGGEVNIDGGNNNGPNSSNGCGELDFNANTYIFPLNRIDSAKAFAPSHTIGGFSGTSFNYTVTPTFNIFQQLQEVADEIVFDPDDIISVEVGTDMLENTVPTADKNAKSQYVYTAAELTMAGLNPGEIYALEINVLNNTETANFFRIKIKESGSVDIANPDTAGFTEVYAANTDFSPGINQLQFNQPFVWSGDDLLIEFSYSNPNDGQNDLIIEGGNAASSGLSSRGDYYQIFDGTNSVVADNYKGISGNTPRTVEAWIRTDTDEIGQDIVSWGVNNNNLFPGGKWIMRVNNNEFQRPGRLRVEVGGGQIIGNIIINDGLWHHVACTFEGDSLNDVKLYVDGVLDDNVVGNTLVPIQTNTEEGIDVVIGASHHTSPEESPERTFIGSIDEVRVWGVALSQSNIQDWMKRKVETPNSELELYYQFESESGPEIIDSSESEHNGISLSGGLWGLTRGEDIFKCFDLQNNKPNLSFVTGDYEITTSTEIVNDTVFNLPNPITEFVIITPPQYDSDDILEPNTFEAWEAIPNQVFNPDGDLIETIEVEVDGTIEITELQYWLRRPSKMELMSFVTPFGVQLDLGQNGKTWTFDITDFSPVFEGTRRITMERGGQWQEEMDIKFQFVVGTPPADVLGIDQIWRVENTTYPNILNDNLYEPRDVPTLAEGALFKVRSAVSGHGEDGEFTPQTHWLNIAGGDNEFEWLLSKECAINPIYPQKEDWPLDRSGWCPGAPTDLYEWDITQFVNPGESLNLDYGLNEPNGDYRYIANHQMVTYGSPNHALDARVLEVRRPSNRVEFTRMGTICTEPEVVIQNAGSQVLESLTITYWVNDDPTPETFEWTGSLDFLETEVVVLPTNSGLLWEYADDNSNTFSVQVSNANGSNDEYPQNDLFESAFDIPEVAPSNFIIVFNTNLVPEENSYEVLDADGNIIFSRDDMLADTEYRDTLNLEQGCYVFRLFDSGDDGLLLPGNGAGNGSVEFEQVNGPVFKDFPSNFGRFIDYHFTIDLPLSFEELHGQDKLQLKLYPNPAQDNVNFELVGFAGEEVSISVFNSIGQLVKRERVTYSGINFLGELNLSGLSPGIYTIQAFDGELEKTQRIVKQ